MLSLGYKLLFHTQVTLMHAAMVINLNYKAITPRTELIFNEKPLVFRIKMYDTKSEREITGNCYIVA